MPTRHTNDDAKSRTPKSKFLILYLYRHKIILKPLIMLHYLSNHRRDNIYLSLNERCTHIFLFSFQYFFCCSIQKPCLYKYNVTVSNFYKFDKFIFQIMQKEFERIQKLVMGIRIFFNFILYIYICRQKSSNNRTFSIRIPIQKWNMYDCP